MLTGLRWGQSDEDGEIFRIPLSCFALVLCAIETTAFSQNNNLSLWNFHVSRRKCGWFSAWRLQADQGRSHTRVQCF